MAYPTSCATTYRLIETSPVTWSTDRSTAWAWKLWLVQAGNGWCLTRLGSKTGIGWIAVPCEIRPPPERCDKDATSASDMRLSPLTTLLSSSRRLSAGTFHCAATSSKIWRRRSRGGGDAGVPDRERRAAALGAVVVGRGMRVDVGDVDVGEIDAELFGQDLRRASDRAAAELDRAAHQRHRAVRVDPDIDAGRAARRQPPASRRCPCHAPSPRLALAPADRVGRLMQALLDADARQRLAGRALVAFAIDVAQAELQRIDAEIVGDEVDLQFDGEVGHRSRPARGTSRSRPCWCRRRCPRRRDAACGRDRPAPAARSPPSPDPSWRRRRSRG